ncbi:MAG: Mrp/NBP35 family ATP-binding protein [Terrimicrobiaceae bacterium]
MLSEDAIKQALQTVKYPGFSRDIVSFGLVKEIVSEASGVKVKMTLTTSEPAIAARIREEGIAAIREAGARGSIDVLIDVQAPAQAAGVPGPQGIEGVRHVLAVASGKGGVGKSTVAANLALALSSQGLKVGLCDCDLYGPSIALMFGCTERPTADENDHIIPIERDGLKLMSMGFLLDDGAPAVLRGPMVTRYTQQFLRQVAWKPLDVLILDLPPGTGDIQLTIVQTVALTGAILVTTPQEVALIDARKAASMFEKTNVPVLGIVENMSHFVSPSDGVRHNIFGTGGGQREAARLKTSLLGEIPIEIAVREGGDLGTPIVHSSPESASALAFQSIGTKIRKQIGV